MACHQLTSSCRDPYSGVKQNIDWDHDRKVLQLVKQIEQVQKTRKRVDQKGRRLKQESKRLRQQLQQYDAQTGDQDSHMQQTHAQAQLQDEQQDEECPVLTVQDMLTREVPVMMFGADPEDLTGQSQQQARLLSPQAVKLLEHNPGTELTLLTELRHFQAFPPQGHQKKQVTPDDDECQCIWSDLDHYMAFKESFTQPAVATCEHLARVRVGRAAPTWLAAYGAAKYLNTATGSKQDGLAATLLRPHSPASLATSIQHAAQGQAAAAMHMDDEQEEQQQTPPLYPNSFAQALAAEPPQMDLVYHCGSALSSKQRLEGDAGALLPDVFMLTHIESVHMLTKVIKEHDTLPPALWPAAEICNISLHKQPPAADVSAHHHSRSCARPMHQSHGASQLPPPAGGASAAQPASTAACSHHKRTTSAPVQLTVPVWSEGRVYARRLEAVDLVQEWEKGRESNTPISQLIRKVYTLMQLWGLSYACISCCAFTWVLYCPPSSPDRDHLYISPPFTPSFQRQPGTIITPQTATAWCCNKALTSRRQLQHISATGLPGPVCTDADGTGSKDVRPAACQAAMSHTTQFSLDITGQQAAGSELSNPANNKQQGATVRVLSLLYEYEGDLALQADLDGRSVVLKFLTAEKYGYSLWRNELCTLDRLTSVQGKLVPTVLAAGDTVGGARYITLTTHAAGQSVLHLLKQLKPDDPNSSVARDRWFNAAKQGLMSLKRIVPGFLHGALIASNLLLQHAEDDNQCTCMFMNLGHSSMSGSEKKQEDELIALREIFYHGGYSY